MCDATLNNTLFDVRQKPRNNNKSHKFHPCLSEFCHKLQMMFTWMRPWQ